MLACASPVHIPTQINHAGGTDVSVEWSCLPFLFCAVEGSLWFFAFQPVAARRCCHFPACTLVIAAHSRISTHTVLALGSRASTQSCIRGRQWMRSDECPLVSPSSDSSPLPTAKSAAETSSSETATGDCSVRHCCGIASNWMIEGESSGSMRWCSCSWAQLSSAAVLHACPMHLSPRVCVCALSPLLSLLICSCVQ